MTTSRDEINIFNNLVRLMMTAAANIALYSAEHRQVLRMCRQALETLHTLFSLTNDVTIKVIDNKIIYANSPISPTPSTDRLLEALNRNGISHLHIGNDIYVEELIGLVNLLSKSPDKQLHLQDSEHISYGRVSVRQQKGPDSSHAIIELAEIANLEADRFMDIYQSVRNRKKLELAGIEEIVDGFVNAFSSQSDAFLALAPLRSMDEYTYTHSTNICLLNLAQAKALGIEGPLLNEIGIAAMLHDVGKMFISPEILTKTEQLDEEEWQIMQQHPQMGADYLITTPGISHLAVVTAYEHHMRFDAKGYPQPRQPWQQHLCSQITAISDTYDAMRTQRAYEQSLDQDEIISIMLDLVGNRLHPQLTYNFLEVLASLDKEQLVN